MCLLLLPLILVIYFLYIFEKFYIAVIIAFFLFSILWVRKMNQPAPRKCPACAEIIQQEAIKCKHCGTDIPAENLTPEKHSEDITQ